MAKSQKRRSRPKKKKKKTGEQTVQKPILSMSGKAEVPLMGSEMSQQYPVLWDYLTVEKYECGTVRQTASLTIFVQNGTLKSCVNDRDLGRSAFFTAATLEALLECMNRCLANDDCDWRTKPSPGGQNQRPPY